MKEIMNRDSSPVTSPSSSLADAPRIGAFGSGRSGPRSRAGCWTCRAKKVKCDEERPVCSRCKRLKRQCDYAPREKKPNTNRRKARDGSLELDDESQLGQSLELLLRDATSSTGRMSREPERNSSEPTAGRLSYYYGPNRASSGYPASIPPPALAAACSVILSPGDHEAIHHYRTSFAERQHTKNPRYSTLSIIFKVAESSPMVLNMILALGRQEINHLKALTGSNNNKEHNEPLQRYGMAMTLMSEALDKSDASGLDAILATIWLMMVYEQRFGDGDGFGLTKHITGAATILQAKCRTLLDSGQPRRQLMMPDDDTQLEGPLPSITHAPSAFALRMISWISWFDSSAASCGLGGQFIASLESLTGQIPDPEVRLKSASALCRGSRSLFRTTWGEDYPQAELLDDIENRHVSDLWHDTGGLRYLVSQLAAALSSDDGVAADRVQQMELILEAVRMKYADIIDIATTLTWNGTKSRLVSNIRFIVSHFHANTLDFLRLKRLEYSLDNQQRQSLRDIMTLSFQSYKDEGEPALLRVVWPLFIAGLETDDPIHQQWIIDRMRGLGRYGKNYRRACDLLEVVVAEQDRLGHRVDLSSCLDSGCYERFVI